MEGFTELAFADHAERYVGEAALGVRSLESGGARVGPVLPLHVKGKTVVLCPRVAQEPK
jgi:hypothetical protein